MSEFQGYCPKCKTDYEVSANKPCKKCGAACVITSVDGSCEY